MKITDPGYKKKIFWILQISGWSAFGVIDSYIKWTDNLIHPQYILGSIVTYLTGILVTWILHLFFRRIKISSKEILHTFFYIIIYSIPASIVWIISDHICSIPIWGFERTIYGYIALSGIAKFSMFFFNSLILIAWSGLYFGIKSTIEWTIQNEKIEKTELLLEIAQLKVLRYQLDPHFLFNSLSSLRMLIRKDSNRAEQMLNKISEFLHYSLASKNSHEVPLSEELVAINHYCGIEKIRFENKFNFKSHIDPLAEDFPVPIFLIHPLIENAFKYGMDTCSGILIIELNATVNDHTLTIEVNNTGHWVEPSDIKNTNRTGMGLQNVQKRLEYSYPNNHKFKIDKTKNKVAVIIEITRDLEQN
jgi:hypothetical protein